QCLPGAGADRHRCSDAMDIQAVCTKRQGGRGGDRPALRRHYPTEAAAAVDRRDGGQDQRLTAPAMLERLRNANAVGLLFSGGSARCVFQVGVTETLYDLGIRPAACLGVSGGAWNAAAVAVGNWRRLRAYWRFFWRM